jgi:hypothetical protein
MSRFILATFGSLGPPADAGSDLTAESARFAEAAAPYVDLHIHHTSVTLRTIEPVWGEAAVRDYLPWLRQQPSPTCRMNLNWPKIGFLMWKPLMLRHVLSADSRVEEGDVVLYHDVNCRRYPQYLDGMDSWRSLTADLLSSLKSDVLVTRGCALYQDVKDYLIRKYLGDQVDLEQAGVWAGLLAFRKSPLSLRLVDEWWEISKDLENLAPVPDPTPHPGMIWNSGEQSTLAIAVLRGVRDGTLPANLLRYRVAGRRYTPDAVIGS